MFSGFTVPPDSKETKQQVKISVGKNIGIVLMPCCSLNWIPKAISGGVDISEVPGCHLF